MLFAFPYFIKIQPVFFSILFETPPKNDLELNSEIQLINKYKTATSEDYKQAIVLIFKERGYTRLEIGQLLGELKAS